MTNYAVLAAQLAVSAASIAASVFLPPPFGQIVGLAISLVGDLTIQAVSGDWSPFSTVATIAGAALSAFGGVAKLGKQLGQFISKTAPKLAGAISKVTMNIQKITNAISKRLSSLAPDKIIGKALAKWSGKNSTDFLEDNKLILKKSTEMEAFGQVRTEKRINSTKFNPDKTSWIQAAHFEETKFINRNNIIGILTIFYYINNDSRLGRRKNPQLNGNMELRAISIPNARYKNEYVSGICKAKSWGAYYMRTWMIGKPGRGPEGINTAFWFGSEWRVDKKIKNLLNSYKNIDKALLNYSAKTAEKFISKTKIGTKLLSFKDVYNKTKQAASNIKSGNVNFMKKHFMKWKKGIKK